MSRRFLLSLDLWATLALTPFTIHAASAQVSPPKLSNDSSLPRTWQIGGYVSGGFAPNYVVGELYTFQYQKELNFYSANIEAGRMLTGIHGPGILKGRVEALAELTPYWMAHSPHQYNILHSNNPFLNGLIGEFASYKIHGVSFTPLVLRWNFINQPSSRQVTWLQAGWGMLWTNQIFPQGEGYPLAYTSTFNFTPQLGVGENLFVKKNQSINLGVRAVNINNEGLGHINPGVPYTLNFSFGYS